MRLSNAMATTAMVPAGQLDLTDGPSPDEADQFNAYRELLFADDRQIVMNGGALQDEQVQIGVDAMGNPISAPVSIAPSMSVGRRAPIDAFSRASTSAARVARRARTWVTCRWMSCGSIAEWLDIGAQYYNNPFDVPVM